MKTLCIAVAALSVFLAAGCANNADQSSTPLFVVDSSGATHSAEDQSALSAQSAITIVNPEYLFAIAPGITPGVRLDKGAGYMVKAGSLDNVYFVAGKITGRGMEAGQWAM